MAAVKIILDTDVGSDCENLGFLALAAQFHNAGEAQIVSVNACTKFKYDPACISATMTWYGLSSIPVSMYRDSTLVLTDNFAQHIAENWTNNFSAKITGGTFQDSDVTDSVALIRQQLAAADDLSIVYVLGGPCTLASAVLATADNFNDDGLPSGLALFTTKVLRMVVMGGDYISIGGGNIGSTDPEWNFAQDSASAVYVTENCPRPVIFAGYTMGSLQKAGRCFTRYDATGPAAYAYTVGSAATNGRETWDEMALLYAIRGASDSHHTYFGIVDGAGSARVVVTVSGNPLTNGNVTWTAGVTAVTHSYLVHPINLANPPYTAAAYGGLIDGMLPNNKPRSSNPYDVWKSSQATVLAYYPVNETGVAGCTNETIYDEKGWYHGGLSGATLGTNWKTQQASLLGAYPTDVSTKETGTGRADLALDYSASGDFSMELWMQFPATGNSTFFCFGKNSSGNLHDIGFFANNLGHTAYGLACVFTAPAINTPHHVVFTRTGTACKLYFDGAQVQTATLTFTSVAGVGSIMGGQGLTTPTNGLVKGIALHTVAMTANQVAESYRFGASYVLPQFPIISLSQSPIDSPNWNPANPT